MEKGKQPQAKPQAQPQAQPQAGQEESLYEIMKRFDKTAYKSVYRKDRTFKNEQDKAEYNNKVQALNAQKINDFRKIIDNVERYNKSYFAQLGIDVSHLRFNGTYSFGDNFKGRNIVALQYDGKNEQNQLRHNHIFLHMDMEKLLQLPAFEVYTILSTQVIDSIMANEKVYDSMHPEKNKELHYYKQAQLAIANDKKMNEATQLFAEYIKEFMKKADKTYVDNGISPMMIAISLRDSMSTTEQEYFLKKNFAFISSSNDALKKILAEKKSLMTLRLASFHLQDSQDVAVNEDGLLRRAVNVHFDEAKKQQFMQLSGVELQSKFDALKSDPNNQEALKGFCSKFISSFAQMYGMEEIELRFVNKPGNNNYGSYHDEGSVHWIEVNLANANSIPELAATLAHELTHAGDSSLNKAAEDPTKVGLRNNISSSVSGSGYGGDAQKLLQEINDACYYVNPNERHGRLGEFAAFSIMLDLSKDNPVMKEQLKASLESYKEYLTNTVDQLQKLDANISRFEKELDNLKLDKSFGGYEMFTNRLEYLRKIRKTITKGNDLTESLTIDAVDKLLSEMGNDNEKSGQNYHYESDKDKIVEDGKQMDEQEIKKAQEEKLKEAAKDKALEDELLGLERELG